MKVLFFIISLSLKSGGPSRSVPLLAKGLAENGIDITLMTFRSNDMNTHAIEGTPVKLKILEKGTTQKKIETYITNESFDLIQLQSVWDWSYHQVARIASKHHIPYIITPRGMLEPWSLSQKKWKKKLALILYQMKDLNRSACIFATAEMEAQHIRELGVKVPISVIPNGIETGGYVCRTSIDCVKKQVLFLSRIHVKKGIELLISAWQSLQKDFSDWKLLVVGNGEDEYINTLKQSIKDKGLGDCIKVLPPVFGEAKYQLYSESALFVLPSFSENFGMVIAEAMSCGVPAITTTNTPWDLLNGGISSMGAKANAKIGWCIDLNIKNLEEALREAISMNSEALYEMGQRASKLVYDNFNYKNVALKTKKLYDWILTKENKPDFIYE